MRGLKKISSNMMCGLGSEVVPERMLIDGENEIRENHIKILKNSCFREGQNEARATERVLNR